MQPTVQTRQNSEFVSDALETPWDEVDGQLQKLDAALAAVARPGTDTDSVVSEKSGVWQSPWQILFHLLMALPLAFEVYYLTHPLMFAK